ncbi:MAG TPA: DASS family sodium-coupled anion symporter, partial [Firmicutes bacterium]|nr:DASS family sodium-coupled anion symporter [Bacillota bacterium]
PLGDIPPNARKCLCIFALAAVLWITEAIPLYVTSFVILLLEALFLSSREVPYSSFITPFFSPTIILFMGGYILSSALHKYKIDIVLAKKILGTFGVKPAFISLGLMLVTAFLSMWMSNTATTAMMITVSLPIIYSLEPDDLFRKSIILCIPFAANIGGIATPIGTPPNAIALETLRNISNVGTISFMKWMSFGFPITVVLLAFAWITLLFLFKPKHSSYNFEVTADSAMDKKAVFVVVISVLTAILWLTSFKHKVPDAIVALLPVIAFLATGILDAKDFRNIGWDVLILLGGGLSLGVAMTKSGLSSWVISKISFDTFSDAVALGIMSTITVALSTFMSNTATTNLLMPIVTKIPTITPLAAAIAVALGASCAMALPISTPPNAIAYGSNEIKVMDMVKAGIIIGVFSLIILLLFCKFLIGYFV